MKFAADKDNLITRALYLSRAFVPETAYTNALSLVFEGGGIESDGAGTLLSTESVIVEPNRNAGIDDEALRQYLIEILGAERLLTLTNGQIEGDDTVFEQEPMRSLSADGQLEAWRHTGFWQPMDTLRDKHVLEELWASGKAPWKSW